MKIRVSIAAMIVLIIAPFGQAADGTADPTKGGELIRHGVEEGRRSRWVGPVGVFCGIFWPLENYLPQLLVQQVEKGSPADGVLKVGDMIIGADGTGADSVSVFVADEQRWLMPMSNAIADAEANDPAILKLLVWRPEAKKKAATDVAKAPSLDQIGGLGDFNAGAGALDDWGPSAKQKAEQAKKAAEAKTPKGKVITVSIELETLGRYADTAPYDCEKSKRILRKGIKALYEADKPGTGCWGALCLLAADDPTVPDNAKYQAKAKEWIYQMIAKNPRDWGPWTSGPRIIAMAEYYLKTKDEAIFPELVKRAEHHASGVSWVGTTGHRWADKLFDYSSGRISGYGALNASGALGFLALSLARKAGVDSPVVIAANERQRIYFGHYHKKGSIIYGEYYYGINGGTGEENGRHAIPALALGLHEGHEEKAKYFSRMAGLATAGNRTSAHAGPYFGTVWQPIAAALGGKELANFHFQEIRWHLDLKRHWHGRRIFDPTSNSYGDYSEDATALLFYALPLKQLYVTGRDHGDSLTLSDAEFAETAATKTFDASKLSTDELIASMSRYLGMLRGKAAAELGERVKATKGSAAGEEIMRKLIALAADKQADPTGRAGACRALMNIKSKAKEPVASLLNAEIAKTGVDMLQEADPYVRYAGARVLHSVRPEAVRPHANAILDAIIAIDRPTFPLDEENPCRWDHGALAGVLTKKVMNEGVDGIDRKKLVAALRSLLETPEGSARTQVAQAIGKLPLEDTLEIAESAVKCLTQGAPVNAALDGAAEKAQAALVEHRFEEALSLSARYNPGSLASTGLVSKYGPLALETQSARELMKAIGDLMLVQAVGGADQLIDQLMKGTSPKKFNKLKRIESIQAAQSTLKLPAAKTELTVNATNYLVRDAKRTRYTWRKVYGAGKVAFSSNAAADSTTTTVSFTDQKPGTYRFEVTMSDDMGLNEISRTVDVTLLDKQGKLPRNRPPQAKSQSLTVVPGVPIEVTLSGTDPDGDDLGFVVTKQPAHGMLSGVGGKLTYVANYGNPHGQSVAEEAKEEPALPTAPSLDDFDLLNEPVFKPSKKASAKKARAGGSWTDSITFEAIDGQGKRAAGTIDFAISDKDVGVAVYEGFDYPMGTIIGQSKTSSFGFDMPWQKSDGGRGGKGFWVERASLKDPNKPESLSFPGLPRTGGKYVRGESHRHCSRPLDPRVLSAHGLLDNGGELWFSLFVTDPGGQASTLTFGLSRSREEPDVGFAINGKMKEISAIIKGATSATSRTNWSRDAGLRLSGERPNMVVGRCRWGKTDQDSDTVEIYRVFDAPRFGLLLIDKPAAVAKGIVSQQGLKRIFLDAGTALDEIRIGPTLNSVMLGTKPLAANTVSQQ